MPIYVKNSKQELPIVDCLIQLHCIERQGKSVVKAYTRPHRDTEGINTVDVFLRVNSEKADDLKSCFQTMFQHVFQEYYMRSIVISLLPNLGIGRGDVLSAASQAYTENKNVIELIFLADPQNPLSEKENRILEIADYLRSEYEDPSCYPEPSEYVTWNYSADYWVPTDSDEKYSLEANYFATPSQRFDPIKGIFQIDEGFGETVLKLIRAKGMTESQCYNKANLSRAAFYKIRQSAKDPESTYRPTKQTAMALAVALELSLKQAADLLERAGYAFSHSNKGDIIVEYFLLQENYSIDEINDVLFRYDQPLLGSF